MSTSARLELVGIYKRETSANLDVLHKLQPMLPAIATLIFKENALEKPTQNLFNNLSYYLLFIIDCKIHSKLTWPLHDTKAERAYRLELASIITNYGTKGLLTPVMSSYLVNPSCYKVTVLIFQLSQLAVKNLLKSKVAENKKVLYKTMTEKYISFSPKEFLQHVENFNCEKAMLNKLKKHLQLKERMKESAELLKNKIINFEMKTQNAQAFIDNMIDNFISNYELNEESKKEMLKIKNVNESLMFFDEWLIVIDNKFDNVVNDWDSKVVLFLEKCRVMQNLTESIVLRYTGQIEKSAYTLEYDPENDTIHTSDLENQVNDKEKFVLRNLYVDGRLNFPNFVRAFFISVCFIFKNSEIGDEIYSFIEYLKNSDRNLSEAITMLKQLNERVSNAEVLLEPAYLTDTNQSIYTKEYLDIPSIPNLSNLKTNKDCIIFDVFTPLNLTRNQFNLRKKTSGASANPLPRILFTSFRQESKENFFKSLISCHAPSYDHSITSQNSHNLSVISNIRANDTIAECTSGFTRQQITKLLSTKKTSSSKKFKYKQERPDTKIKKCGLFNESILSTESNGLTRSYSSPNLFENRPTERRSLCKGRGRKLSIMPEDTSPQFDVSGITSLKSKLNTPNGSGNDSKSRKLCSSNRSIEVDNKLDNMTNIVDFKELQNFISPIFELPRITCTYTEEQEMQTSGTETPKTNTALIRKSSSLEKIIKRFKCIRGNELQKNDNNEIETILEEKENINVNCTKFTANKNLLPDLLSPNCSGIPLKNNIHNTDMNCLEKDEGQPKKPRESLGTALGVDQAFLDQFDLID